MLAKRALRLPMELRARGADRRLSARSHRNLSVCAIFLDEESIVREWIEFHLHVGVEHFYLYDNGSRDGSRAVIAPFIARGLVTLIDWHENPGQLSAYRDCVRRFAGDTRRIAFIDLDEFLFSPRQVDVCPVIERHAAHAGLAVREYFFGSGGRVKPATGPVTASYRRRAADRCSFKTIANPRWIRRIESAHFFQYWGRQYAPVAYSDWDGRPRTTPVSTFVVDPDELRINHYWSRSLDELVVRKRRRSPVLGRPREIDPLAEEKYMNDLEDRTILSVCPASVAARAP